MKDIEKDRMIAPYNAFKIDYVNSKINKEKKDNELKKVIVLSNNIQKAVEFFEYYYNQKIIKVERIKTDILLCSKESCLVLTQAFLKSQLEEVVL